MDGFSCTVWPEPIWIKVKNIDFYILPQHQSTESASIEIPPFQTQIYLVKVLLNGNIVIQDLLNKKQFLKILWSEVWKGGFQLIQILGLLGMYFDAVVVEVKTFLILFILALAIRWAVYLTYFANFKFGSTLFSEIMSNFWQLLCKAQN